MRLPTHPEHALWRWLRDSGLAAKDFALAIGVSHTVLSYWLTGSRWIPVAAIRRIEKATKNAVKLGDWAHAQDRTAKLYWRFGQRVANPQAKAGKATMSISVDM